MNAEAGAGGGFDLKSLVERKVEAEIASVIAELGQLREALDGLEVVVRLETERRVANAVLSVLGGSLLPEVSGAEDARSTCASALRRVYARVVGAGQEEGIEPPRETLPMPAPMAASAVPIPEPAPTLAEALTACADVIVEAAPSGPRSVPLRTLPLGPLPTLPGPMFLVGGEDSQRAERLFQDVTDLVAEVRAGYPRKDCLHEHLQALVAETQALMLRVPAGAELRDRLGRQLGVLGGLKRSGGSPEYVQGLAFGATGDWDKIATAARGRLAWLRSRKEGEKSDAEKGPAPSTPPPVRASTTSKVGSVFAWPALPRLRAAAEQKPILMVGGRVVKEKIDLCLKRFGVLVEWVEVEDAPRSTESVGNRIRGGSVGAVLLLNGFVPHKTSDTVTEACKASGTPMALVDRGGTASIDAGLRDIEKRLGGGS